MTDTDTIIAILGATGNLTRTKLMPALFSLYRKGRLPDGLRIVGIARDPLDAEAFRDLLQADIPPEGPEQWAAFSSRIGYVQADVTSGEDLERAWRTIADGSGAVNCLCYLALPPVVYSETITALSQAGMADDHAGASGPSRLDASGPSRLDASGPSHQGWRRIVVEKPFGSDGHTAKRLNEHTHSMLREDQVYRVAHYLGKETVQNLLVFRFANSIFEPVWNRNYIDRVEISVDEDVLVGDRGEYYDHAGVLKDMFQSHLLQLLALVAMDPPHAFTADALRNEKVRALSAVRLPSLREIGDHLVIGQYQGYHSEPGVAPGSQTPTYAALRLFIDNWRWQGVPFYLRSGKGMADKNTEMTVSFRSPPHMLFPGDADTNIPGNRLVIRIQPFEGIHLELQSKVPDAGLEMRPVSFDFSYDEDFTGIDIPDAYERLLLDAVAGDASLFTRSDEIELAWSIIDPIVQRLDLPGAPTPYRYLPGMNGPPDVERLLGITAQ